jgi:CheY-like chemotaxis protein
METNKLIMLIDDDSVNNFVNTKIIKRYCDYAVIVFQDAREALTYFRDGSKLLPDFVFLDLNMPFMDGWEFLEEFAKLSEAMTRKPTISLLTSSIDLHDIERSKKYRYVSHFFSKPLSEQHFDVLGIVQLS